MLPTVYGFEIRSGSASGMHGRHPAKPLSMTFEDWNVEYEKLAETGDDIEFKREMGISTKENTR